MVLHFGRTQREQSAAAAQHTTQQTFFLERLARLHRKATLLGRYLVPTDRRLQMLNRALLSTYEDCHLLGVGEEARELISVR